jgi:hypothetical protein
MTSATSGRAELRLRVLNALPRRHQDHVFAQIRASCRKYIASIGVKVADRDSETLELFSEAMAKLLGAASQHHDRDSERDEASPAQSSLPDWTIDERDPQGDGRVAWLIDEVGGTRSLSHRYEDMRRQRWGRWQASGYRTVQISALQNDADTESADGDQVLARAADASVELHSDPDAHREANEMRLAWLGLLVLAEGQFSREDDVMALLTLLARESDIQASFGSEWPIGQIVQTLNAAAPARPWNDDRVDNAKRRLRNWIQRLRRDQALDRTDLLALLIRCALQRKQRDATAAPGAPKRTEAKR